MTSYRGKSARRQRAPLACGLIVTALLGCVDRPPLGLENAGDGEPVSLEQLVAESWVGVWDGFGVVTEDGTARDVSELVLRIAFDAPPAKTADCPSCLTVVLEPWFSTVNLRFTHGASAFPQDTVGDVIRSLAIQRFSGGTQANTLLIKLRHERPGPGGTETLVDGDLQFVQR